MASSRHLSRIIVLQIIYEYKLRLSCKDHQVNVNEIIDRYFKLYNRNQSNQDFIKRMIKGVLENENEIDNILQPVASSWPLEQIPRLDHHILQMGVFELKYSEDVPAKVAINEAIELSKKFGGNKSSKFINGVLGTIYNQLFESKPDSFKLDQPQPVNENA